MLITAHHGTTATIAARIKGGEEFTPSTNIGDWLGTGIYFWQDAPKRAAYWARRAARRAKDKPAVLETQIDLTNCLDLLDLFAFNTMKVECAEFERRTSGYEQDPLVIEDGATVYPPDGTRLVDRNKKDKALFDFATASIEAKTGKPVPVVRSAFLWGEALHKTSFVFDWSNVHICVRDHSAIQSYEIL